MVASTTGHASLLGTIFAGYEVYGLIGRGAVGTVYLAKDVKLKRPVALKALLGSLARDPAVVKSFHREAQAAAPLRHPNIVRIYSAGIEGGTPYIAMEYVEGEPLDRFLKRKGRIKWQSALHIAQQVAEALDCAHACGIVHRDVKPANIMLDRQGRVCLTDFGIANIQTDDTARLNSGSFVGTPHYMSPEQCAGGVVTSASDLYSLGVTLYQMIAGSLPFDADTPMTLIKQITTDEAPRLSRVVPEVPDDVARLASFLIQKRPQDRPSDARSVCQVIARIQGENGGASALPAALNAFIREQAEPAPLNVVAPTPWRERIRERHTAASRRASDGNKTRRFIGIGAGAALVCLVAGFAAWQATHSTPAPAAAPVLEHAAINNMGGGVALARLDTPSFVFADLSWVGAKSILAARLRGIPGTLAQDAAAAVAVDPETGSFVGLGAPAGPALGATFWRNRLTVMNGRGTPDLPPHSPLHDSIVTFAFDVRAHSARNEVAAFAQSWNEAAPRSTVLYRAQADGVFPAGARPWEAIPSAHAVVKPDGYTLCLVLQDAAGRSNYLAERDIRWKPAGRVGPRLTGLGAEILPESVQYSPDGAAIIYVRDTGPAMMELWTVASGGGEVNGTRLAYGDLEAATAFSPTGASLAIGVTHGSAEESALRIISATDGTVQADLGPGTLGAAAWHPSGDFLVVAALAPETAADGGPGGMRSVASPMRQQLWAVETRTPHRRKPLTALARGVRGPCAVSRDGRWAAAVAEGDGNPTLVFVDLTMLSLRSFAL